MDESQAVETFAALAQETRLKILRLLVRAGPDGLAAGAIGEAAGVSPSNASFHLGLLERSGLIGARREARSIIYSATYPRLAELIRYLMDDCCAGDARVIDGCLPRAADCRPARKRNAEPSRRAGAR
jgi:ArsR family transcriptional regulator